MFTSGPAFKELTIQGDYSHSYIHILKISQLTYQLTYQHVFAEWEEIGVPRGKSTKAQGEHANSVQTVSWLVFKQPTPGLRPQFESA